MGVLPRLQELGYRFEEASWLDETGRRCARLRFKQFGKIEQGRLFSILRPDLEQALRDQLSGSIDLRFAISLSAVHHTSRGVRVTLDDGGTLDADLLVGADGIPLHRARPGLRRPVDPRRGGGTVVPDDRRPADGPLWAARWAGRDLRRAPRCRPALPPDPVTAIRHEFGRVGVVHANASECATSGVGPECAGPCRRGAVVLPSSPRPARRAPGRWPVIPPVAGSPRTSR
jgi:hypothetical protein